MPDYRINNAQISIFSKRLRKICLPNCSQTRLYYPVLHALSTDVQQIGAQAHHVKTASINKVLIAFVHRITLRKHLYSQGLYAESVCAIIPKLDYIV